MGNKNLKKQKQTRTGLSYRSENISGYLHISHLEKFLTIAGKMLMYHR